MSERKQIPGEEEEPRVVIRDRRRIDPETGQLRTAPAASIPAPAQPDAAAVADDTAELRAQLAERTSDVQRVSAEYANYRRRVDRDRAVVADAATGAVLASLIPVLDDIDRAAEHGDVTGPFKSVADQITVVLAKHGLQRFGATGDPFDPNIHEAVMHSTSVDVSEPTCVQVMRAGYRQGERLLRPAMVAVAEPELVPAADTAEAAVEE